MKTGWLPCGLFAFLALATCGVGRGESAPCVPTSADYAGALQRPDGSTDLDALAMRLKQLGVGTYYWLVEPEKDWTELQAFLPRAAKADLQVWVYLVPPSENGAGADGVARYPAPFLKDYQRWGEEIARLSLQHTNLTGLVIDDFDGNLKFFTPDYVREMRARAKSINPRLAFLPLAYFGSLKPFVTDYRELIDGIVVAYPQDRAEIRQARAMLDDADEVLLPEFNFPGGTHSQPGEFAAASKVAKPLPGGRQQIRFRDNDNPGWNSPPPGGYHLKQLLVDGAVVWEEDVATTKAGWEEHVVDITSQATGRTNVTVSFRLLEKKGVSNYGAHWRLADMQAEGLESPDFQEPSSWQTSKQGAFETGFGAVPKRGRQRFHIPFVVMTAATPGEFTGRHGGKGSPEEMAAWLRMCLEAQRDGQCDAVVTYCLDKNTNSSAFDLDRQLFHSFNR